MTLLDFAKSKDPNGTQAQVIELMNQINPLIEDGSAVPSNAPYGDRVTYRRSLPTVGSAKINKGVTRSKSQTDQRQDVIGMFAGRSELDIRIREVEGSAAFQSKRLEEDQAFEEAFAQYLTTESLYGDVKVDEASFDGFMPRLNTLNPGTSMTTPQVRSLDGAGSGGDLSSILIIDWGDRAVRWIFPPNTVAGLKVSDIGDQQVNDNDNNPFTAAVTTYDWFLGLGVKDPRHMARLANIDVSAALAASPTNKILDSLELLMTYMPEPNGAQRVLYCPIAIWAAFNKQARAYANLALSIQDYLGKPTPHFWGYPIRKVEKMSITETQVT
jgi:hypothetical protein